MRTKTSNNPHSVPHSLYGAESLYYMSHRLSKKKWGSLLSKILKRINQFIFHVNIPPAVKIGKRLELAHGGFGIVINPNTIIGDDAIIFHNVTMASGGARIGHRVYIGANSVLLGAISIGDDVVIGANAVVNFDVPDNSIVVGPKDKIVHKE